MEKLMHKRMYSFLEKYNCLYELQFGFRTGHNTDHALIHITEMIKTAIDDGKFACGIFVDLQKAFDTVEYSILLTKLNHYGIRGISNKWLHSYLSDRSQYIKINNKKSASTTIRHGVPQGSVLGPLLFLIYINDLHLAMKHSRTIHFADDTSLKVVNKSLKLLNKHVNHDLSFMSQWLRANKISMHAKKPGNCSFPS